MTEVVVHSLMVDNYLRKFAGAKPLETFDLVRLGKQQDFSPDVLMDSMERRQELSFTLADTFSLYLDTTADWLLGESRQHFPFVR